MRSFVQFTTAALLAAGLSSPLFAQEVPMEGPAPTTALISVETKHDAQFNPSTLALQIEGHTTPIVGITPIGQAPAQVAILIDDGLRRSFSSQISEIAQSLQNWPAGTQLLIGYMENGTVRTHGFTTSPEAVAGELRIPFSSAGMSASPYLCLSDFVKNWPGRGPGARIVLMLTNGVDPYNGRPSVMNQDSPYVEAAQNDAQRAGVAVYSIYFGDAGFRGGAASFSGQNYLQQVAEATGGQTFNQGTITPPSILPYLNQFRTAVGESFLVSFNASSNHEKGNTLLRLQVKTSQKDVKVHAPQGVHPGNAEMGGKPAGSIE